MSGGEWSRLCALNCCTHSSFIYHPIGAQLMLWMSFGKQCGEELRKNFQGRDKWFKLTGRMRAVERNILRNMNNILLSEQGSSEPTCWRRRQGFGKTVRIFMLSSPIPTPQMPTGTSWAKSKVLWFPRKEESRGCFLFQPFMFPEPHGAHLSKAEGHRLANSSFYF